MNGRRGPGHRHGVGTGGICVVEHDRLGRELGQVLGRRKRRRGCYEAPGRYRQDRLCQRCA